MTAGEIVRAFGGPTQVATMLGLSVAAVSNWRRRGIPSDYWHLLVREAAKRAISGIDFDTLSGTKSHAS